jgi:excinuclease ABC subunit A
VGLDYLTLGQSAATLSGGESQRLKIAKEFQTSQSRQTLYILDEPTTGLHFREVDMLLKVMNRLIDAGGSVIVIEHNLEVIKNSDYIIDLGPEGGQEGGEVVCSGTPEQVKKVSQSHTGFYLKNSLL